MHKTNSQIAPSIPLPPKSVFVQNGRIREDRVLVHARANLKSVGRALPDGTYAVRNKVTGREIIISEDVLRNALDTARRTTYDPLKGTYTPPSGAENKADLSSRRPGLQPYTRTDPEDAQTMARLLASIGTYAQNAVMIKTGHVDENSNTSVFL